jgi:hypothetical protein
MHARLHKSALAALLAAPLAIMALAAPARAETLHYAARLAGATEVPPNTSKGSGMLDAAYDTTTKRFTYDITYKDLTGPATAAHFHGPAAADANAPPVIPITGALTSPIKGEATLTEAQAADLAAGKWYFNVHTGEHKGGEIRGQIEKK